MDIAQLLLLSAVTFVAALVQGAVGIGFALFVTPIFLTVFNSVIAVQVTIFVTLVTALAILPKIYQHIPKPLLLRLILGNAAGALIGIEIYRLADVTSLKLGAGIIVTVLAIYLLTTSKERAGDGEKSPLGPLGIDLGIGVATGIMTTTLGMTGPAAALYFTYLHATKQATRSAIFGLFVFGYTFGLMAQAMLVGIEAVTWMWAIALSPAAYIGTLVGNKVSDKLNPKVFRMLILAVLIASGTAAIISAVWPLIP